MITFLKTVGIMDLLMLLAVVFLVVRGFIHGCSGEMGHLIGVAVACAAGFFCFAPVADAVASVKLLAANPSAARLIVFVLVLIICIAIWLGVKHLLSEAIRLVLAQPFNAIVGGIIGGIKACIFIFILCALGLLNPLENGRKRFYENSVTVQKLAPLLKPITSE